MAGYANGHHVRRTDQTARRMLREAGFHNVTTKKFEPDIEHVYYTATKA